MPHNSTNRFSNRVANYVKYRPSYPLELINCLKQQCSLNSNSTIADIGAGTGIFSELILEAGFRVTGIEPNREMRQAADNALGKHNHYTSGDGTAENTGLPDKSVDLITAAQAFHWFDQANSQKEFLRILKPGGWLALIWNERLMDSTEFLCDYEAMLQAHATDYNAVNHINTTDELLVEFFSPTKMWTFCFSNSQLFDFDGLKGRLLSSSYAPDETHPGYLAMITELERIFEKNASNGTVSFDYETKVYLGQIKQLAPT